ncbi:hypothetical protein ALC57_12494 [Trachymyrmex cornetzi]|uniref:Uncharacterized protein n=1 Tax=Trachymyrmex cornetzi TaxID=471704 RepID=A0A195DRA6_9HYME|nr:hypothetical protein ALC57_12494 [Trachymyrmex cornetzi]
MIGDLLYRVHLLLQEFSLQKIHEIRVVKNRSRAYHEARKKKLWRSWDLNPGLSACEADTLPLSYTPNCYFVASNHSTSAYIRI